MELEVAAALLDASRRLSSGDVTRDDTDRERTNTEHDCQPRVRTGSLIPFTASAMARQLIRPEETQVGYRLV